MILTASSCLRYLVLARMGVGPALGAGDPIDLSQGPFVFDSFAAKSRPVNTDQALEQGWTKASGACDPALGEAWLLGGELSPHRSATLYFTPAAGGAPGVLSGVAAHYYDTIPAGQVGTFFSPAKEDSGGRQYHSVAVALYDTTAQDVCDDATPLPATAVTYLAVVSHDSATADRLIPTREDDAELNDTWMEGSCIAGMGYHWLTDVAGGDPSYDHNTMLPVVAMYHPVDKSLTGWFFWGAGDKRDWDDEACPIMPAPLTQAHQDCLDGKTLWDVLSLAESNANNYPMVGFPLPKCVNTCDWNCSFKGSTDGMYTTMHWWVQDVSQVACPGPHPLLHCRNDFTLDQYNPFRLLPAGSCAFGYKPKECKQWAKARGKEFEFTRIADHPGGCALDVGLDVVRYNKYQDIKRGTGCEAMKQCVCHPYSLEAEGGCAKPLDAPACAEAAEALGKRYDAAVTAPAALPRGCFAKNRKFRFNDADPLGANCNEQKKCVCRL